MPQERPLRYEKAKERPEVNIVLKISRISLTLVLVRANESCSYLEWEIINLQIWQMTNMCQNRPPNGFGRPGTISIEERDISVYLADDICAVYSVTYRNHHTASVREEGRRDPFLQA